MNNQVMALLLLFFSFAVIMISIITKKIEEKENIKKGFKEAFKVTKIPKRKWKKFSKTEKLK